MAEKEYIELGELIEAWRREIENATDLFDAFDWALGSVPAADVVEVVHARWIENYTRQFFDKSYETGYHCSRCKRTVAVAHELYDTKGQGLLRNLYPYCHCGAKMDGGKDG